MPAEVLTSPDDPRLAPYRALRERPQRPDPERIVVESEVAVRRLLASGRPVASVLVTPARLERVAPHVPPGTPLYALAPPLLREVVGFDLHRGCVACAPRPPAGALPLEALAARPRVTVVVAEALADPVNVGALARNCRAFGADLLVVDGRGADPYARRAVRASMGHVFTLPLVVAQDLPEAVASLAAALPGVRVLAADPAPGALALPDLPPAPRNVLLVGNEGRGLGAALGAAASLRVRIPIDPAADSLNAAAASAVLLYALTGGAPGSAPR